MKEKNFFGTPCNECGRFITFADDSTIIFRGLKGDDRMLSMRIDNTLIEIHDFLAANNLKLNISKTQVLRTASRQQLVGNRTEGVVLEAKNENMENIRPLTSAKILGVRFSKSLTWKDFLEVGTEAIIPKLKKKLGALKFTCRKASYNAKLKLAHGCIMSQYVYIIVFLVHYVRLL